MKKILFVSLLIFLNIFSFGQGVYIGSGSVTQGIGTTTNANIFPGCTGASSGTEGHQSLLCGIDACAGCPLGGRHRAHKNNLGQGWWIRRA